MCNCVVVAPIGSKLSDKFGCRAVTIAGSFLLCTGLALCSLATKLVHVYLALGVVAGRFAHCILTILSLTGTCTCHVHKCFVVMGMIK